MLSHYQYYANILGRSHDIHVMHILPSTTWNVLPTRLNNTIKMSVVLLIRCSLGHQVSDSLFSTSTNNVACDCIKLLDLEPLRLQFAKNYF